MQISSASKELEIQTDYRTPAGMRISSVSNGLAIQDSILNRGGNANFEYQQWL